MPYRPADAADHRPAVGVVAHSAPVGDHDLVPLLRKRLQFLLVVFALYFLVIVILHLFYSGASVTARIDFWASAATFVACLWRGAAAYCRQ